MCKLSGILRVSHVVCLAVSSHGQADWGETSESGSGTGSGSGTDSKTVCHTHIGTYSGNSSICKSNTFSFKKCVNPTDATALSTEVENNVQTIANLVYFSRQVSRFSRFIELQLAEKPVARGAALAIILAGVRQQAVGNRRRQRRRLARVIVFCLSAQRRLGWS